MQVNVINLKKNYKIKLINILHLKIELLLSVFLKILNLLMLLMLKNSFIKNFIFHYLIIVLEDKFFKL